jgi:hypothetical protein
MHDSSVKGLMSPFRCLPRSRFNLFFHHIDKGSHDTHFATNHEVVAISAARQFNPSQRATPQPHEMPQQIGSPIHRTDNSGGEVNNISVQACRIRRGSNDRVVDQYIFLANLPLTYRFDRSHVDQATGSVTGITNT